MKVIQPLEEIIIEKIYYKINLTIAKRFRTSPQDPVTVRWDAMLSKLIQRSGHILVSGLEPNICFFETRKDGVGFSYNIPQLIILKEIFIIFRIDQLEDRVPTDSVQPVVQVAKPENQVMIGN